MLETKIHLLHVPLFCVWCLILQAFSVLVYSEKVLKQKEILLISTSASDPAHTANKTQFTSLPRYTGSLYRR